MDIILFNLPVLLSVTFPLFILFSNSFILLLFLVLFVTIYFSFSLSISIPNLLLISKPLLQISNIKYKYILFITIIIMSPPI